LIRGVILDGLGVGRWGLEVEDIVTSAGYSKMGQDLDVARGAIFSAYSIRSPKEEQTTVEAGRKSRT
jgi:hypothetical protein